jgi:hypothetical protein
LPWKNRCFRARHLLSELESVSTFRYLNVEYVYRSFHQSAPQKLLRQRDPLSLDSTRHVSVWTLRSGADIATMEVWTGIHGIRQAPRIRLSLGDVLRLPFTHGQRSKYRPPLAPRAEFALVVRCLYPFQVPRAIPRMLPRWKENNASANAASAVHPTMRGRVAGKSRQCGASSSNTSLKITRREYSYSFGQGFSTSRPLMGLSCAGSDGIEPLAVCQTLSHTALVWTGVGCSKPRRHVT